MIKEIKKAMTPVNLHPEHEGNRKSMISVVLPVFNEVMNLRPFYDELMAEIEALREVDWEIIFVDDGSTDASAEIVLSLRAQDARVKLLRLSRNFGSHAALTAGLRYAQGDAAVIMSVDLQDPPEIIPNLLKEWKNGHHVVWGIRRTRKDPWSKKFLAGLFYRFFRKVALPDFPEGGMDLSLFDRRVINELLEIHDRHGYLFATVHWMGFRQACVPYDRAVRLGGVSKWSLARRFKAAIDLIVSFSYFPIRFMSYLGLTVSLLSFLYAIELVFEKVFLGKGGVGWPSLMVTILFLGGVQLTMMGVLGEYLWRATEQVKGKPPYIIMEAVGFDLKGQKENAKLSIR